MTGCHNCEHAAEIAAGKYAEVAWEEVPCSTCDVMSGAGFSFVPDDNRIKAKPSTEASAFWAEDGSERMLPISVMREVVLGLLTLPPELRDVVSWRHAGMSYSEIALAIGVTPQCVEKRHCRAMQLWPALKELFPGKRARVRSDRGSGSDAQEQNDENGGWV